jgi:hypothetical protein
MSARNGKPFSKPIKTHWVFKMGFPVNHKRMKAKQSAPATAKERAHMERVAALPCLVCGGNSTVHHVTGSAYVMGRLPRSHQLVVPLCPTHHQIQHGPKESVEALNHRGFYKMHGIDLLAEAEFLRLESINEGIL